MKLGTNEMPLVEALIRVKAEKLRKQYEEQYPGLGVPEDMKFFREEAEKRLKADGLIPA